MAKSGRRGGRQVVAPWFRRLLAVVGQGPACAYAMLLDRRGDHEDAWPSVPRIALDIGASRRATVEYLRVLTQLGLLKVEYRHGHSSHYRPVDNHFIFERDMTPDEIRALKLKEKAANERKLGFAEPSPAAPVETETEKPAEKKKTKTYEPTPEQVQLKTAWAAALKETFPSYDPLPWSYVDEKGVAKLSEDGKYAQELISQLGVERAERYVRSLVVNWSEQAKQKFPTLGVVPTLHSASKFMSVLEPRVASGASDDSGSIQREVRAWQKANPGRSLPRELRDRYLKVTG